jgi:hypothetical protein
MVQSPRDVISVCCMSFLVGLVFVTVGIPLIIIGNENGHHVYKKCFIESCCCETNQCLKTERSICSYTADYNIRIGNTSYIVLNYNCGQKNCCSIYHSNSTAHCLIENNEVFSITKSPSRNTQSLVSLSFGIIFLFVGVTVLTCLCCCSILKKEERRDVVYVKVNDNKERSTNLITK